MRTVLLTPLFLVTLAPRAAWGQDAGRPPSSPPAAAPSPPPPDSTPQEQAEIERALAADAAQADAARAPAAAVAPPRPAALFPSLVTPDISLLTGVSFAWFSTDENLQTGGHDPTQNGFNLQYLELALRKSVDPYFRFDSYLVFGREGVEIEEAYATTLALPGNLQARAGLFLTRFGRLNSTHPHAWDFVDQPFALGRLFGGEGNRGLGAELSYLTPLPWYVEIVGSVSDPTGEGSARSFYGASEVQLGSPLDLQAMLALKQFFPFSEDWSLLWGLSGAGGPNPTGDGNRSEIYGTDLYLKYRPITRGGPTTVALQTEWFYRRRQVPGDTLQDLNGYAYLLWKFAQRWGAAVRYEHGSRPWGMTGTNVVDYLDPYWTDHRHRASANLTFWPSEYSRLRVQGSSDVLAWQDRPTWAAFLAFEVVIGAHGAHRY